MCFGLWHVLIKSMEIMFRRGGVSLWTFETFAARIEDCVAVAVACMHRAERTQWTWHLNCGDDIREVAIVKTKFPKDCRNC